MKLNKINQIVLQFEDGRKISIIQNSEDSPNIGIGAYGNYGETCEVIIDGDKKPKGFLTAERLIEFLQGRKQL